MDHFYTTGEILEKLGKFFHDKYLPHYYEKTCQNTAMGVMLAIFNETILLIQADFAAQTTHNFEDNLCCSSFGRSNCEVVVVSRHDDSTLPGEPRKCVTECWFMIGGTNTKGKEADSHFHHTALCHITEHYKVQLGESLLRILLETDNCAGQYKVRGAELTVFFVPPSLSRFPP